MSVSCLYSRIDLSVACRLADIPLSADSLPIVGLGSSSSKLPRFERILYLPMLAKFYLLYLYTLTYILFKLLLAAMDVHSVKMKVHVHF